ncbi:TPA: hypothetical protein ACOFD8_002547 [Stenotrophomonas maltophilia]
MKNHGLTIGVAAMCTMLAAVPACGRRADDAGQDSAELDACYYRVKNSQRCDSSFQRLMLNPASAAGRQVGLVGYLAPRSGVALLYPDEQSYLNDVVVNAVALEGDLSLLSGKWYKTVRLRAVFHLTDDPIAPWFGVMRGLSVADPVVPLEREDPVVIHEDVSSEGQR